MTLQVKSLFFEQDILNTKPPNWSSQKKKSNSGKLY